MLEQCGCHTTQLTASFAAKQPSIHVLQHVSTHHLGVLAPLPSCQALVGHAMRLLPDFSPQNLSNTAWALATLREHEPMRLLYRVRLGIA